MIANYCILCPPSFNLKEIEHQESHLYHLLVMVTNVDMVTRGVKRKPQFFLRLIFNN